MEFFNKILESHKQNEEPNPEWIKSLQKFIEEVEIRKSLNAECVYKYSQTDQGKLKRRQAQARYQKKKNLEIKTI